jgi:hypothetical protein
MDKDKPRPDEENIDLIIDKKIADAKLDVSESRLRFVLWIGGALSAALIAVFGIILPMWQTQTLKEDVHRAIDNMEKRFAELTGEQLRKPEIECYLDGEKLEGAVMHIEREKQGSKLLYMKNTGDKETSAIKLVIYTKEDVGCSFGEYYKQVTSLDETENGFKFAFRADPLTDYGGYIRVQARGFEIIEFQPNCRPNPTLETAALLKVYYGQPEPKIFRFTVKFPPKEKK